MKKIIYLFVGVALLTSCDKEEYLNKDGKYETGPTATIVALPAQSTTFTEDEDGDNNPTYEVEVTLSKPYITDITFYAELVEATASEDEDFSFSHEVTIPAGKTTAKFSVDFYDDCTEESSETFKIKFGSVGTANASIAAPLEQTFTVENYLSDELNIYISWALSAPMYNGATALTATQVIDIDTYVYSFDLDEDVAAAETGGFETMHLNASDLEDGSYLVYGFLWDRVTVGNAAAVSFPMTVEFDRCGRTETYSFTQATADAFSQATARYAVAELLYVEITGGEFSVRDLDETEVAKFTAFLKEKPLALNK